MTDRLCLKIFFNIFKSKYWWSTFRSILWKLRLKIYTVLLLCTYITRQEIVFEKFREINITLQILWNKVILLSTISRDFIMIKELQDGSRIKRPNTHHLGVWEKSWYGGGAVLVPRFLLKHLVRHILRLDTSIPFTFLYWLVKLVKSI